MPNTRQMEPRRGTSGARGEEAGFVGLGGSELEDLATTELRGTVEAPRLVADAGLWVTLIAREPYSHARILVGIRPRARLDDRSTELVLQAAAGSRSATHPRVIPAQAFGCTDELLWITMREHRGRLLSYWFGGGAGRKHAHPAAIELLRHVGPPLQAMHDAGLVHGALATSSFHRDQEGIVRALVPGVNVPIVRANLAAGVRTEAADCAAPEVGAGREPVPASDQYAVAAMIVRLLSGRSIASGGDHPIGAMPPRWRSILRRALAPDPEERFPTMAAFCGALDPDLVFRGSTGEREGSTDVERGRAEYVPSAFRARRTAGDRLDLEPTPSRALGSEQLLFPGEPWDDEPWDHVAVRPPKAMAVRRFVDVIVLSILIGGVLLFRSGRIDGLLQELRGRGAVPASSLPPVAAEVEPPAPIPPPTGAEDTDADPDVGETDVADARDPEREATTAPPVVASEPSPTSADASPPTSTGSQDGDAVDEEPEPSPEPSATDRRAPAAEPSVAPSPPGTVENPIRAAPPAPGTLSMQSYPWGVVYVDGDYVGTTPFIDLEISPGPHRIRVEREAYAPYTRDVIVQPGQRLRLAGIILKQEGR